MSPAEFRYSTRFTVTGEADPQLPARVIGLIATLNVLPLDFRCQQAGHDRCRISMLVDGGDETFRRRIASQLLRIPTVISARAELRAARIPTNEGASASARHAA